MNFQEWLSLSDAQRESEKRNWHVFEAGYWHSIAHEAVARFATEFTSAPHVRRIVKSLYHSDELIVAVQTDLSPPEVIPLPEIYLGFRVLQFAGRTPEGVLVDVQNFGPQASNEVAGVQENPHRVQPVISGNRGSGQSSEECIILPLEGEIDLHISPEVAADLENLIKKKPKKLVIDLSKVSYVDSSGLSVLLRAMQEVEHYGGKCYLIGLQETVRVILESSGLDQAFRILPDVAAALAAT
jgi:anti-sigma B factor antagonist